MDAAAGRRGKRAWGALRMIVRSILPFWLPTRRPLIAGGRLRGDAGRAVHAAIQNSLPLAAAMALRGTAPGGPLPGLAAGIGGFAIGAPMGGLLA